VHPEGGSSPALWDVPEKFLSALGLGASRSRNRLMELLSILEDIRLITPLQQSQSETVPYVRGERGSSFPFRCCSSGVLEHFGSQPRSQVLAHSTVGTRPSLGITREPPAFWKTFPLRSLSEGEDFWKNLKEVSLHSSSVEKVQDGEIPPEDQPNLASSGTRYGAMLGGSRRTICLRIKRVSSINPSTTHPFQTTEKLRRGSPTFLGSPLLPKTS
jgi:hypothetical protein